MEARVFKGISSRAKSALDRTEGLEVEFKESPAGLDSSDLVAFANSDHGGVILIGVKEAQASTGARAGSIVGCQVGDRTKLAIQGKSESCTPPVAVELYVENSSKVPFLRIEVPSGRDKPYCTSGGTYKIRGDGCNKAMSPGLLLSMFVERESHEFLARFRRATESLERQMDDLKDDLVYEFSQVDKATGEFRDRVEDTLGDVGQFAETAQNESEIASSLCGEIHTWVQEVSGDVVSYGNDMNYKLDAILLHLGLPDPAFERVIEERGMFAWAHSKDGASIDDVIANLSRRYPAATQQQLDRVRATALEVQEWVSRPLTDLPVTRAQQRDRKKKQA